MSTDVIYFVIAERAVRDGMPTQIFLVGEQDDWASQSSSNMNT